MITNNEVALIKLRYLIVINMLSTLISKQFLINDSLFSINAQHLIYLMNHDKPSLCGKY